MDDGPGHTHRADRRSSEGRRHAASQKAWLPGRKISHGKYVVSGDPPDAPVSGSWVVGTRARLSRHPQERADLAELAGQLLPGGAPVPAAVDVAAHAAPKPEPWVGGIRRQVPDRAVGRDRER